MCYYHVNINALFFDNSSEVDNFLFRTATDGYVTSMYIYFGKRRVAAPGSPLLRPDSELPQWAIFLSLSICLTKSLTTTEDNLGGASAIFMDDTQSNLADKRRKFHPQTRNQAVQASPSTSYTGHCAQPDWKNPLIQKKLCILDSQHTSGRNSQKDPRVARNR